MGEDDGEDDDKDDEEPERDLVLAGIIFRGELARTEVHHHIDGFVDAAVVVVFLE